MSIRFCVSSFFTSGFGCPWIRFLFTPFQLISSRFLFSISINPLLKSSLPCRLLATVSMVCIVVCKAFLPLSSGQVLFGGIGARVAGLACMRRSQAADGSACLEGCGRKSGQPAVEYDGRRQACACHSAPPRPPARKRLSAKEVALVLSQLCFLHMSAGSRQCSTSVVGVIGGLDVVWLELFQGNHRSFVQPHACEAG